MDGSLIYRDVWQLIVVEAVADEADAACLARLSSWKRVCRQWRDWMTDDVLWQPLVERHAAALRALRAWDLWTNEHRPRLFFLGEQSQHLTTNWALLGRFYRHYATRCEQGRKHVRLTAAGGARLDAVLSELSDEAGKMKLWSTALELLVYSSSGATWFDLIETLAQDRSLPSSMIHVAAHAWAAGDQDPYEAILALVYFHQNMVSERYYKLLPEHPCMIAVLRALEGLLILHGLLQGMPPVLSLDQAIGLDRENVFLPRHYWGLEVPLADIVYRCWRSQVAQNNVPPHLGHFVLYNSGPLPPDLATVLVTTAQRRQQPIIGQIVLDR